jgi:polar amino acid transport system substrate-binding protein
MRRSRLVPLLLFLVLLFAAACGGETTGGGDGDTGGGGNGGTTAGGGDLLSQIKERGTLVASTDPAYPPQSSRTPTGEFEGFDIDVINEIADRLGVDVKFVTPAFDAIVSGGWSGRWDVSVGSITITPERQRVLHFTEPYYYTPASIAVHSENTDISDLESDLDGKRIGVCRACSYESYLKKDLTLVGQKAGQDYEYVVDDAQIESYDTDTTAIQDLALGDGVRLDAVMSALPTLEQAIANDTPIKIVGDPLFYEPLGVAVDKKSPADPTSFFKEVDRIVHEMHQDGTLSQFSEKWYDGTDLTKRT